VDIAEHRPALRRSIYTLLASLGHPVAYGEADIHPVHADAGLAEVLQVEQGSLLQHLIQVDYSIDGTRVLLSYEWHDPRVIEFRVVRRGPGPRPTISG
jgi:GntR family transcriptional regulator